MSGVLSDSMSVSSPKAAGSPSEEQERTTVFLRKAFREHYFRHHDDVEIPAAIQNREFGYIPFDKGMIRHLSYKSSGELAADLVKQAPSSVFCSNAVYANPTMPMDEKGWKGAELIFDIDASAIPTACAGKHSYWSCRSCGKVIRSAERPQSCPKCEGTSTTQLHWSCQECLGATKEHVSRLIGFLTKDFGVSSAGITVYFSGNRGYHLHVEDERFEGMDSSARAEIANYVKGTGLTRPQGPDRSRAPPPSRGGWQERVAASATNDQPPKLEKVIDAFGSRIDESVTTDIHRIFRMPGTLHGNSGLLKVRVHDLQGFRPDYDPVVFGDDDVEVLVQGSPAFSLKGRTFGPYSSEEAGVPAYAAVYLMTKGLATVVK
jgi:DNA primase small subunit